MSKAAKLIRASTRTTNHSNTYTCQPLGLGRRRGRGVDFPSPLEIIKNANGTETHISYRYREDGKKVKTTRIIKKVVNKTRVDPRVAERRGWAKFGASANDSAGPQNATTSVGENIELHPRQGYKGVENQEVVGANAEMEKGRKALKNATVKCRICNGEHFTARCPFKGTMAPEGEPAAGEPAADPMAEPATRGLGAGKSSYVPPALRDKNGAAATGERMGGKYERDDLATLRVTNLGFEMISLGVLLGNERARLKVELSRKAEMIIPCQCNPISAGIRSGSTTSHYARSKDIQ